MLAVAMPTVPASAQTPLPPPLLKANTSNCGAVDAGRYGAAGKNACDNSQLMTIGPAENKVVTIDDSGFHPADVTVGGGGGLGDTITFVNLGTQVHSATQLQSSPMWAMGAVGGVNVNGRGVKAPKHKGEIGGGTTAIFDTGGITPNPGGTVQTSIAMGPGNGVSYVSLGANGDYVYSSYPDCIAADRPPAGAFDCKPAVVHVVDNQEGTKELQKVLGPTVKKLGSGAAVGTVLRPVGDPDCAMLAKDHPIMAPGRTNACVSAIRTNAFSTKPAKSAAHPYTEDPQVTIDDIYGFDPGTFTIIINVPITFTNKASNMLVHDVVFSKKRLSDSNPPSGLQSGGLQPGQAWTFSGFQYVTSGSPGWSSDTESDTLFVPDQQGAASPTVSAFLGKAAVVCPPGQFTALGFDQWRGLGQSCQTGPAPADPAVVTSGTVHDY
jgi:plastocyanin